MRGLPLLILSAFLAGPTAGPVSAAPAAPAVGRFVIAAPHLEDRNFRQTVILLVAADETGALGLIVNRPAAGAETGQPAYYFGGPVPASRPFVLFRSAEDVTDAGHVVDDVYVTVSESVLESIAGEDPEDARVRIFIGYAGWGPGQLEAEIARGDWTLRDATGADVFSVEPRHLWRRLAPAAPPLSARLAAF